MSGYVSSYVPAPYVPTWTPARDLVAETPRVLSSTVTNDIGGGTSSKLSTTSSQVSNTVIATYNTLTENGVGGFLNTLGTINYAGKTVTFRAVDPSTTATSYKNDTESSADFGSAVSSAQADPGASNPYTGYQPANSASTRWALANALSG